MMSWCASCREQISRLGLHSEMASQLADVIRSDDLIELGTLEQNLVYGEATSKQVLAYLQKRPRMPTNDKVSLAVDTDLCQPACRWNM